MLHFPLNYYFWPVTPFNIFIWIELIDLCSGEERHVKNRRTSKPSSSSQHSSSDRSHRASCSSRSSHSSTSRKQEEQAQNQNSSLVGLGQCSISTDDEQDIGKNGLHILIFFPVFLRRSYYKFILKVSNENEFFCAQLGTLSFNATEFWFKILILTWKHFSNYDSIFCFHNKFIILSDEGVHLSPLGSTSSIQDLINPTLPGSNTTSLSSTWSHQPFNSDPAARLKHRSASGKLFPKYLKYPFS